MRLCRSLCLLLCRSLGEDALGDVAGRGFEAREAGECVAGAAERGEDRRTGQEQTCANTYATTHTRVRSPPEKSTR